MTIFDDMIGNIGEFSGHSPRRRGTDIISFWRNECNSKICKYEIPATQKKKLIKCFSGSVIHNSIYLVVVDMLIRVSIVFFNFNGYGDRRHQPTETTVAVAVAVIRRTYFSEWNPIKIDGAEKWGDDVRCCDWHKWHAAHHKTITILFMIISGSREPRQEGWYKRCATQRHQIPSLFVR